MKAKKVRLSKKKITLQERKVVSVDRMRLSLLSHLLGYFLPM